jgi:hypothetical protein
VHKMMKKIRVKLKNELLTKALRCTKAVNFSSDFLHISI